MSEFIILCVAVLILSIMAGKPAGWVAFGLAMLALLMTVLHWSPLR